MLPSVGARFCIGQPPPPRVPAEDACAATGEDWPKSFASRPESRPCDAVVAAAAAPCAAALAALALPELLLRMPARAQSAAVGGLIRADEQLRLCR